MASDCGPGGLVGLVIFVGVVALAALAVAIVALVRPEGLDDDKETTNNNNNDPGLYPVMLTDSVASSMQSNKIWTIAIGSDYGAVEFVDDKGYVKGFSKDLIAAVCDAAGVRCETVVNQYSVCWEGPGAPGKGLHSNYFDACAGWLTTVERIQVFQFSHPFSTPTQSKFFIRNNDRTFSATDIRGRKIGFLQGWASNPGCLARQSGIQGNVLPATSAVFYTTTTEAVTGLKNRQVDAIFVSSSGLEGLAQSGDISVINTEYQCLLAGLAVMTRKDSEFVQHWNRGFQKIRSDGDLASLCSKANTDYAAHGKIDCVK